MQKEKKRKKKKEKERKRKLQMGDQPYSFIINEFEHRTQTLEFWREKNARCYMQSRKRGGRWRAGPI